MRYFLCLLPPIAVIVSSKNPLLWFLSILLTLAFYVPGFVFALFIVSNRNANKRTDKLVKAMKASAE